MTTATLTQDSAPAAQSDELTIADRCDASGVKLDATGQEYRGSCDAQAFVRVVLPVSKKLPEGGQLLFCGHCYGKHEAALAGTGAEVHDKRTRINAKPSVSANAL